MTALLVSLLFLSTVLLCGLLVVALDHGRPGKPREWRPIR